MTNRKKYIAMEGNINIEHIIILSDFVLQKYYFRGILWIQRPNIFQLLYHIETDPSCQEPLYPINELKQGIQGVLLNLDCGSHWNWLIDTHLKSTH